jgi:hypothetical protein
VADEGAGAQIDQITQLQDDVGHKQGYDGLEYGPLISFPLIPIVALEPEDDQDQSHYRGQKILVDQQAHQTIQESIVASQVIDQPEQLKIERHATDSL